MGLIGGHLHSHATSHLRLVSMYFRAFVHLSSLSKRRLIGNHLHAEITSSVHRNIHREHEITR
jgi:hypothetical protein